MDLFVVLLIVLILLSFAGWGYGSYYPGPSGAAPSPLINLLGVLGFILLVGLVVMLLTGWRFGVDAVPPTIAR